MKRPVYLRHKITLESFQDLELKRGQIDSSSPFRVCIHWVFVVLLVPICCLDRISWAYKLNIVGVMELCRDQLSLLTNERPTWCHLLFYFTYYALDMFRILIYPSSGACDCVDKLPHRSSCSQFVVCWSFWCGWVLVVFVLQAASACKTNTTKYQPQQNSNTQRTENKTTDVVIHEHSRSSWRWIY